MTGGLVAVLVPDLALKLIEIGRKELHRTAALGANHVMVAAAIVLVLIAGNSVVECNHAGEATLGE